MVTNTTVTEFVLLGFSVSPRVQTIGLSQNPRWNFILFLIFLTIYVTTWLGNLTIIFTVIFMPQLHTPMYFLLANLAALDISDSTVTSLKLLAGLLSHSNTISYNWCIAQIFFFHFTGASVDFLLTVMAVDRYIAIYKPLKYVMIMNQTVCISLVASSWLGGFVHSIVQIGIIIQLPFCGPNILDNFYCDIPQVVKLACTDTYITELLMVSNSGLIVTAMFLVLLVSYSVILVKIRTHVTEGKHKALSTCTAHMVVLSLNFVPAIFMYNRPFTVFPGDKFVSAMYTLITPMLNPMIFTLRNTEMKNAIRKLKVKMVSSKSRIFIGEKSFVSRLH
ncbi:olfactory receptor 4D1-like [Sphaerodactylus townsendi]|uniref:olfactory receptor 4D1-like n=1 Tax=Sphaerodactylus townsendi TaxID=933632 RepID=UPI0020269462|nr:olfactory receptor 4D1-like [Sphaerodactylus townsendi]